MKINKSLKEQAKQIIMIQELQLHGAKKIKLKLKRSFQRHY